MKFFVFAFLAFVVTFFTMPIVIRLSKKYKCLDMPGKRKFHHVLTPRWGGLALFLGTVTAMLFSFELDRATVSYLIASAMLVIVGMIDDRRPLGWKIKMSVILAAVTLVVFGGDTVVRSIGFFGSWGNVELGVFSVPFTYFGVVGLTNAMNLLDGLNGLAAGSSLLGFLFIGIAAAMAGNYPLALGCAVLVGVLAAFMPFNFPKARIFMGDSGSLFLGFSLAVFSIHLTQQPQFPVSPVYPFVVLLLPIFDAVRVMVNRMLRLKNPFRADKGHLHHLLVRRGMSPVNSVLLLWFISLLFGCSSLLMVQRTSVAFLAVTCSGVLFLGLIAEGLVQRRERKQPVQTDVPLVLAPSFNESRRVPSGHVTGQ